MKIVIPATIIRDKSIGNGLRKRLESMGATVYEDIPSAEEFKKRIAEAEIITVRYSIGAPSEIIDASPNLKYIVVPAVGYESVDIDHATKKGIKVLNCPTHNNQAVAEYAISLLLTFARQLIPANSSLKQGKWDDESFVGAELEGKTIGLIGYGNIGKRIAKMTEGLGMSVKFVNSKSTELELNDLLSESDYVCICAPLNDKTYHLLSKDKLDLLKQSAVLINVGRGAIIDQKELIDFLKSNKIKGAALDVFEGENIGKDKLPTEEIKQLTNLPNVIAFPHIAYNTTESLVKLAAEIIEDIQSCLDGKPVNIVNLK